MIKVQNDAGYRDREVRGKETEGVFEDGGLFCLVTDHTVQSVQSSFSLQEIITQGQRSAGNQTATGVWMCKVEVKDVSVEGLQLVCG